MKSVSVSKEQTMILTNPFRITGCLLLVAALIVITFAPLSHALGSRVHVRMDPVTICQPEAMDTLTIYLENPLDSIAALKIWLQLDRPDICKFMPGFDTTGTLLSGWEFIDVRSLVPGGTDVQIVATAEGPPYTPPFKRGFPPHPNSGRIPLIRIPVKLLPIADTMFMPTAAVLAFNSTSWLQFSDPNGNLIGLSHYYVWDTLCFRCLQPSPTGCLQWQRVTTPPCDSSFITVDTIPYLDTNLVYADNSTISRCCPVVLAGDVDGNGITMSVSDLVALIRFVSTGAPPLPDYMNADVTGDCRISWADVWRYDSLFVYGCGDILPCYPFALCTCPSPVRYCCQNGRGNVTGEGSDVVDIEDLFALIDHLTGAGTAGCVEEADVDASGSIDISDAMALVDFLGGAVLGLPICP